MLAKEVDKPFDDKDWVFEIKWDGYRAVAEVDHGDVALYSRNGNSFISDYPEIVDALGKIQQQAVLDGEVVVVDEEGHASFQALQHYESKPGQQLVYYVFDLLALNGEETTGLTLLERKELLREVIPENGLIKYSDHVVAEGKSFFNIALQQDLEGIMAKKASSNYHKGSRSANWLKIKQHKTDEAVIVGYTEPTGNRPYFGALVLALKKEGALHYAGHTGTGFSNDKLKEVYRLLKKIETEKSPFPEKVKTNMPVTWVKPEYVAEIKFTEKTIDGKMRHPVFLHMRPDKNPKDIEMEKEKIEQKTPSAKQPAKKKAAPAKSAAPAKKTPVKKEKDLEKIGGKNVRITNRDKIYFPDDKVTKGDVIDYYQTMAEYILPYLKDRPESLKRNPGGIEDSGFFHKDAGEEAPSFVKIFPVYSESSDKTIDYIICNDKATLAYMNNLGCIEINPWNSTTKKPDNPDYLIIDIDPSDKNTFEQVIETAICYKKILDKAKADCYCKTSGSTGLHIFLPMGKKYDYEAVKDFAHLLSSMVQQELPKFTTLERNLKKRGNARIYLDYLQNRKGQTLASAYSLRPKKGATVSTPLEWKEVKKGLHTSAFTMHNILDRVNKKGDLFKGVLGKAVDISKCLELLGE